MKKKIIIFLLFLIVIIFLGFEIHRSNFTLEVSNCTVSDSRISEDIRMVLVADLHNREFGEDNEELLSLVRRQNPDIICCVGDFVMDKNENTEVAETLIKGVVEIAPTYFSVGNHEVHHQMNFPVDFESVFESYGANVLEYEFEDIDIDGQSLRIGGIYGCCIPENDSENMRYNFKHTDFLKEFMKTDEFTFLLTHLPYTWLELDGLEERDIDLVDILQQELIRAGVLPEEYDFEAHKELVSMQTGNVPVTYADTSALERDWGFKPSTSLRIGRRKFAEW